MPRIAVIGGGPAGMAAAIQLSRAGHDVTVFEPGRMGGNLWNAGFVENYPGFPGGISGRQLAGLMEEQFMEHGIPVKAVAVSRISKAADGFVVSHDTDETFDGVIVCTGTRPRKAGFPGEDDLASAGLLHYGIANLPNLEIGSEALVVGGGESSMDMSLSLVEMGLRVTLLHRSEPRAIRQLLDEIEAEDCISLLNGTVDSARAHGAKAVARFGPEERPYDIMVVAVGRDSNVPELVGIDIDAPTTGFRIAGDARHGGLGQTAMAVGDGVRAAMDVGREARR